MRRPRWGELRAGIGSLLFPGPCCLCDGPLPDPLGGPACSACRGRLVPLLHPACSRCGIFFVPGAARGPCGACLNSPPPFDRLIAALPHEGLARRAVHELKYRRRETLAPLLAVAATKAWAAADRGPAAPAAVVPVPAPFWRRVRRGFHPAESIADGVARRLRIPLRTGVLRRRHAPPQTGLSGAARRRNVRGVFRARRFPAALRGQPLLLVDDVSTTGSTARAGSRELIRAGSGRVEVLTFARAGGGGVVV